MDLAWSDEVKCLIDETGRFAEASLTERRSPAAFDRPAWDACGRQGLFALPLPHTWGGRGGDALTTAAVFESLGRGGADRGLLFAMGAHLFGCALAIARFGTSEQQAHWGKRLAAGTVVAALAATEPAGGSSVAHMGTSAQAVEGQYVLRGSKTLVTNGPVADLFLVIASGSPQRGALGLTAFLVPRDTKGLRIEALADTLGMRGAPMARLVFDDCRLPKDAVLGRPSGGLAVLLTCMQYERTCILAGFLGAAERDLAMCIRYAQGRRDEHGPLLDHQAVSHRLARMKCRIECARGLLYRGAWAIDHEKDQLGKPAMVKLTVSETVVACALDVLRTFAGAGWLDEGGTATALRDVVGTLSASGTSDVQLNLIATCLPKLLKS